MVSCLTLINSTHALALRQGDRIHTLCGLAMDDADTAPGLLAQPPAAATCARCQTRLRAEPLPPTAPERRLDARSLVEQLVAQLNANDGANLDTVLDEALLASLSAQRLDRLHQLFPGWHASIDELISDHDTVVLRYQVNGTDGFGLLGAPGPLLKTGQAVVLRLTNRRVIAACPIVDDFGFWSGLGTARDSGCAHCAGSPQPLEGKQHDRHCA